MGHSSICKPFSPALPPVQRLIKAPACFDEAMELQHRVRHAVMNDAAIRKIALAIWNFKDVPRKERDAYLIELLSMIAQCSAKFDRLSDCLSG